MIPGITASRVSPPAPSIPVDPHFANVVALLRIENAIIEMTGAAVAPYGSSAPSSAQSKFGTQSLACAGSGQGTAGVNLQGLSDRFVFPGEFTFEGWFRPNNSFRSFRSLWDGQRNYPNAGSWTTQITATGGFATVINGNFSTGPGVSPALTHSVWQHVAVSRDAANVMRIFIDGVLRASAVHAGTLGAVDSSRSHFNISRGIALDNWSFDGFLEEIRVTKGVCRYTESFTPPAELFAETTGSILDDSWNPLGAGPGLVFSNGDHTIVRPIGGNDAADNGALSKRARSHGKVYAEATMNRDGGLWSGFFGFINAAHMISLSASENYTNGVQVAPSRGGSNSVLIFREGTTSTVAGAYASGVVVGIALDIDAGKAWVRCNDDWITSTNTKTTVFDPNNPTATWPPAGRVWRWYAMSPFSGTEVTLNVGATAFARTPPPGFGPW